MSDQLTDFSPNLSLPYLLPAQAQKHVTVNETITAIDTLLMGAVISAEQNTPPSDLSNGDAFIVGPAPSGEWQQNAGNIATWVDGAWVFRDPKPGWRLWDQQTEALLLFDGSSWSPLNGESAGLQNIPLIGIGTSADENNPLSVRGPGALFTARDEGDGGSGDFRLAINAETDDHIASLIFQSGYSGRAEFGLGAGGHFNFRMSPDGANWKDAISINPADGYVGIGTEPDGVNPLSVYHRLAVSNETGSLVIKAAGLVDFESGDGSPLYIRNLSEGANIHFGITHIGGSRNNNVVMIRTQQSDILHAFSLAPQSTDALDLGTPARRYKSIYLQNAPVISSDARQKLNVETFDQGLELLQSLYPVSYERAGDADTRHVGLIAQHVRSALKEHNLTNTDIWHIADPEDPDSDQSVRYTSLIPVMIDAINELAERIEDLEARLR